MYVGMNRYEHLNNIVLRCVPHVRGDEPNPVRRALMRLLRSPCTWG